LTLLHLVIENNWTSKSQLLPSSASLDRVSHPTNYSIEKELCFLTEYAVVVGKCEPCTDFEIVSGISKVCNKTHRFKQAVKCVQSNIIVFRSCDKVEWLEERKFWAFESLMFAIGVVASGCVIYRQKVLDQIMMRRVQNQLNNCV
ncbi:hypothetical protein WDU94_003471, partial [Cyamophila willieti]